MTQIVQYKAVCASWAGISGVYRERELIGFSDQWKVQREGPGWEKTGSKVGSQQ